MSIQKKSEPHLKFIPPRLTEGKEWYVSYYAIYPATGQLRRVKIKLNRIKSITQRRSTARLLIADITKKLLADWNPFIEADAPKAFHFLFNVLDTYMKIQEKELERHSIRSYKSYVKHLKNYLLRNNFNNKMYVSHFDRRIASDMMIEIKENPKYSFRTYNNYLQFYITLFNWLLQFNYISVNPFAHLRKIPKKKIKKIRTTLSHKDREELRDFLINVEDNNNYFVMCLMCYYCFLRPNEISLLRVKDIDLKKQQVYISADIAKNDENSIRIIPDAMMEYVQKLNLNYPPDYYLFSMDKRYKFVPGKKIAESREIGRYWRNVIRPSLKWPDSLQFYSLKDTGITNMLSDGVAPNFVQGQADHSSLSITSVYVQKKNSEAQEQIRNRASAF